MDENESDFNIIQKEHQENIRAKLTKFTSNEISFYTAPLPAFLDLNDSLNLQKTNFINQFLNHYSSFDSKLFSDRMKYKFLKEFTVQNNLDLIKFFQKQIEHIKWRNQLIYNRINDPKTYSLFSNYYPIYVESTSKYFEECNLAIQSLESEKPDSRFIELALKYDFYHHFCHFQIENLLYIFKKFALIRRNEILSIVKESLINDIIFDSNSQNVPMIIQQSDDLIEELKRISSLLNIEFDIDDQDGQHFSYSCEKLYFKTLNQSKPFKFTDNSIPDIEYPNFIDRLNDSFIKNTPIDEKLAFSFDNLVNPSESGMEQIMLKFDSAMIRELTRDKVTALVRLQFCRNKNLLDSIIKSIKIIEKVSKEILKEDLPDFFNLHFSIFRKIALVFSSSIKSKSKSFSVDNESLIENVLDLYDQFYKCKVKILNALLELSINSQNADLKAITNKFIEFRPDLVSGGFNSSIQPFRLSIKILNQIGSTIRSLINLQIFTHNEFCLQYGQHYPWFQFPTMNGNNYQLTNDSFPRSFFDVFLFIQKTIEFLHVSREVVLEVSESFSARSVRYQQYFEYAIWTQLLNEMSLFMANLTPESYLFNMKMTEKVSLTMISPYLNDLNFILNVINDLKGNNKLKFIVNFRNMIRLGWKLQSNLIKSDLFLKIYTKQLIDLEDNDSMKEIDFAYGDYEFSAISNEWTSSELEKIVTAQHLYQISLEIAVRFNNYQYDIYNIQRILEMNKYENPLKPKSKIEIVNRFNALKKIPSLLFYEPNLINENLYSNCSFCYITAAKEFVDKEYVLNVFLPYCIRSEIAFISILERCFLHTYTNYDVFFVSTNTKETFLDSENKLNHFLIATIPQALLVDRNPEILHGVLRFLSIRYQLLKLMQHDIFLSRIKTSDLEEIYNEKLLWNSNLFSRIKVEIHRFNNCDDVNFSVNYFRKEREIFCSKQTMVVLSVMDLSVKPQKEIKKNQKDANESYSFESIKSYFIDINRPNTGSSSFIDSSLYIQTYLNQFWYQCNDLLRTEFTNYQSLIEKQVTDSVTGFSSDKFMDAIYDFAVDSMRFLFIRLALFYLDEIKEPEKVTINSIINNLTKEILFNGIVKYDTESNIQATYKTDMNPEYGTLEANFLKAKIKVSVEKLENLMERYQIDIFTNQFQKENDFIESVFNSPTTVLKPECYSERIPMKSQQIFIPPLPSIKNQFSQEVYYWKSRFCRMLCNCISKFKKKDEEGTISINLNEFVDTLKELSITLSIFFNASRSSLEKTWKGYIQNMLFFLKQKFDSNEDVDVFIKYFIRKFNNNVKSSLIKKLKDDYIKVAHLRDKEKVIIQEQEHFEKQEAISIRKEFELLVRDLNEEIRKAKLRFIYAKNRYFNSSFNAINKFKDDPNYVDMCVLPPITDSPKPVPPEDKLKTVVNENETTPNEDKAIHDEVNEDKTVHKEDNMSLLIPETETKIDDDSKFETETKMDSDDNKSEVSASAVKVNDNENHPLDISLSQDSLNATEVEIDPGSAQSIIIAPPESHKSILLTATDKIATIIQSDEINITENQNIPSQLTEQSQNMDQPQATDLIDQPQATDLVDQPQATDLVDQPQNTPQPTPENKPVPPKSEITNRPRRLNLKKNLSSTPKFKSNLPRVSSNISLTGRRSINFKKYGKQKAKPRKRKSSPELVEPDLTPYLNSNSRESFEVTPKVENEEKTREMIVDVKDRIENTKNSIEELQELRKKLRITTTMSAIAVKRIYTRMIAKVAEERKNHSATLWHGRRLLEEDVNEKNAELKEAYQRLNMAEEEIESLQEEIAKTKETNVKLLHAKEMNIREVEVIHKELKKVNNNPDVNVSQLIKKIAKKREELDILMLQEQKFQEEVYYQITEPMMQLDQMRRELTIRRGQMAEDRYIKQMQQKQQNSNQEYENSFAAEEEEFAKNSLEEEELAKNNLEEEEFIGNNVEEEEMNGFEMNYNQSTKISDSSKIRRNKPSLKEQINKKISIYREANDDLRQDNQNLRNEILEYENRISQLSKNKKKILDDIMQIDLNSSRPKSNRTIFRPGMYKSVRNSRRPGTGRNNVV